MTLPRSAPQSDWESGRKIATKILQQIFDQIRFTDPVARDILFDSYYNNLGRLMHYAYDNKIGIRQYMAGIKKYVREYASAKNRGK